VGVNGSVVAAAREAMARRRVPGMVVAVASSGGEVELWSEGVAADAVWAVASVTKLATALGVLRLVEAGELRLEDELWEAAAAGPGVTIGRLMAHTSGLPQEPAAGADWRAVCLATPLARGPGTRVVYSNAGYGLLGVLIERATRQPFAEALRELVLGPLGVVGEIGEGFAWAGLRTDARGALALVRAYRAEPLATRDQSEGLDGGLAGVLEWSPCPWGLGPELRGTKGPRHWAPGSASAGSWGHAGQSGCVVWHEPASDVSWFIAGTRDASNGWLLDAGPAIGEAVLAAQR
jgi:CubicO group peptidase (beta-lactamase class C family)